MIACLLGLSSFCRNFINFKIFRRNERNVIIGIPVFRSIPEKIWPIPSEGVVKKLLASGTAQGYDCGIGFRSNIVPLSRRYLLSYFLNAITNKYMKSSGLIVDVALYHLTVSPEDFFYQGIL